MRGSLDEGMPEVLQRASCQFGEAVEGTTNMSKRILNVLLSCSTRERTLLSADFRLAAEVLLSHRHRQVESREQTWNGRVMCRVYSISRSELSIHPFSHTVYG